MATRSKTPAPWREKFLAHVNEMESPEFVFATLQQQQQQITESTPTSSSIPQVVPRARYCIFRGLWAELPENKHNNAPRNERSYSSDLPTFTTDARMHKGGDIDAPATGSGGGGPCEAVWWSKPTKVQWRVRGKAFVVGPDIDDVSGRGREVREELLRYMRTEDGGKGNEWSWTKELTAHFGNLSPGMRGTFAHPPPGRPVDERLDDPDRYLKTGEKVEDLHHKVARSNFRVVVIVPTEVESVDLSDPATARRQLYQLNEKDGSWLHQECWP